MQNVTKEKIKLMNRLFLFKLIILLTLFACQSETKVPEKAPVPKETAPSPAQKSISDRFEKEIQQFEASDKENGYSKNGIVFTGSSSIRMWSTLVEDMDGLPVLNRGFGGATNPEVIHFAPRYLFQHQPQIIVYYCGENDISEGGTPEVVAETFKLFTKMVNANSPTTKIVYISMKPSVARWNLWDKYVKGDRLIKSFIDSKENITYFDSSLSMLQEDGNVKTDIFIKDNLHMNAKGYEGWTNQLLPVLKKMYQK